MDWGLLFHAVYVTVFLLFVPGYFIVSLWRTRPIGYVRWALQTLYTGAFLLFVFLVGPWDWVGYYVRYVMLLGYLAAAVVAAKRIVTGNGGKQDRWRDWGDLAALLIFLALVGWTLPGYFHDEAPLQLDFPLQDGWYYVGQGGSTQIINYHAAYRPQKYALDIVALNGVGMRANGLYPADLHRYAIFGRPVYSPCDGWVTHAIDGLPDFTPPASDRQNVAGNHVIVNCDGVSVVLAHLQEGSVAVEPGAVVSSGQPIGAVGNSGNTSEPHLHIHAVRSDSPDALDGEPVPIEFNGRFLVRNSTWRD